MDQTRFEITFSRDDLEKFNEILAEHMEGGTWWNDLLTDEPGAPITAVRHQANYGWHDELKKLAEAKLPFIAFHDSGTDYGACTYASYGGEMAECNADITGTPNCPITKDCRPDALSYKQCIKYWLLVRKITGE